MNKFFNTVGSSVSSFIKDEEGAQVVEYALIISLVSIGVVVLLAGTSGTSGLQASFTTLLNRITVCFGGTVGSVTC
jgi:pilus assembly protein Flp/PilA